MDARGWIRRRCKLEENTGRAVWTNVSRKCLARCATLNLTENLYDAYLNSYLTGKKLNITELRQIWNRTDRFKSVDLEILLKSFKYLPEDVADKDVDEVLDILAGIVNKTFSNRNRSDKGVYMEFASGFGEVLTKLNQRSCGKFRKITGNLLVASWCPFQENIKGFLIYHDVEGKISRVKQIYMNESDFNGDGNLEIAVYIPENFLEIIREENSNFSVILIFVKNDSIFSDYFRFKYNEANITEFIGVSFPNFCKRNNAAMLKIYFDESKVAEFGREYLDSSENSYNCLMSQFSYFAPITSGYFESAKREFCMATTTLTRNNSVMHWGQTPIKSRVYQKKFCADKDLIIPSLKCNRDGVFENDLGYDLDCVDHVTSNLTQFLYNSAVRCKDVIGALEMFNRINFVNYVDVKLYFHLLICLIENDQDILKDTKHISAYIDKGFSMAQALILDYYQNHYIANFFTYFLYALLANLRDKIFVFESNFTYLIYKPFKTNILGLVVYKRKTSPEYDVKILTTHNLTKQDLLDSNIESVVYLTNKTLNILEENLSDVEKQLFNVSIAVIFGYKFVENEKYSCTSHIIAITYDSVSNLTDINFYIYLKTIMREDETLSTTIPADSNRLKLIFVSQPKLGICDIANRITIYQLDKVRSRTKMLQIQSQITDVILKLWIFINPSIKTVYNEHYHILQIIMSAGSILSLLGITSIFITALFLKNWTEKRRYSLQLATAIALQTIYFIRDSNSMNHFEYILFYYFTLSQFSWMLFIGYIQYLRYVKVFQLNDLGICKPMLINWVVPLIITAIPIWVYRDCFHCNLCSKNGDIFIYFVMIPISLVILANIVIYIAVMVSISKTRCQHYGVETGCVRKRAAILLPFLLGISWIFIFALIFPWSSVILVGFYTFYTITPLSGFALFVFVILADKSTRLRWVSKFKSGKSVVKSRENSSKQIKMLTDT